MIQKSIPEGNLEFIFPDSQKALKYDDIDFYRSFFCKIEGTKAVDIVSYDDLNTYLIEIKDFSVFDRKKKTFLSVDIAQKIRDSISGLYLLSRSKHPNHKENAQFAKEALQKNIRIVIYCQVKKKSRSALREIEIFLKRIFRTIDRNIIVESQPNGLPWKVIKKV